MSDENGVFQMKMLCRNRKACRQIAGAFALAVCLGALPVLAQQNQQDRPPAPVQQPGDTYTPGGDPQGQPPSYQQVPPTLTLPAGTVITVRVSQFLSSDQNRPGDEFHAVLEQPVVVDGWVIARRGQTVLGRVAVAQKAGHGNKQSQLGVELSQLILVDGQQLPLRTQLTQASGGTSYGRDATTIGVTTGVGAVIGAIAGGRREAGEGAGIGAAAGAAAGIIGVLLTPGKPTVIPPETQLTFRQEYPLNISTVRSAQAFQPVTQQDYAYETNTLQYRPQRGVAPGYPPPPAPYYWDYYAGGYPGWGYPGWGYYPGPFFGFYGAYGFGPRVFIGRRFGGFGRRGFRR